DRPNIHIVVPRIKSTLESMQDLGRVLNFQGGQPKTPFMVFENGREDSERLGKYLHHMVLEHLRDKFVCFHSGMSMAFRIPMIEKLRSGELWGIFCTDAAGMVSYYILVNEQEYLHQIIMYIAVTPWTRSKRPTH
ncbi:hypothetical protein HYDPIDRAFT_82607, partial [Hydnomerulius pinastri MD-312]